MEPNTTNETAPGVGRLCVFGAEAAGVVSSAGAASEADPLTACRTATASRITLRQNRSRGQSHHLQHGHYHQYLLQLLAYLLKSSTVSERLEAGAPYLKLTIIVKQRPS
jgi:hypothetical protein